MNKSSEKYYLGLDIGTNSVGWAVTDETYHLCKHGKKDLWGIRLFESGEQAAKRRAQRTSRRRTARRKERIDLLQMIFAEEMAKIDDTFFIRLNESRLHLEDKTTGEKFPLFIGKDYSDVDYYDEFPTIYHLRRELIENPEPHDIRLVYLAIHHIIKNRGHFLIDGDLKAATDFDSTFAQVMLNLGGDAMPFAIECDNGKSDIVKEILESNDPKSVKAKKMKTCFAYDTEDLDKTEEKSRKGAIEQICKLICGNKGDLSKLFYYDDFSDLEKTSFSFAEQDYEDTILPALQEINPDEALVIESIKTIYDWSILSDILGNSRYLSAAKVDQYEKHARELRIIRRLIKTYCPRDEYNKFFNGTDKGAGYSNYIGEIQKNGKKYPAEKCTEEEFYKNVKKTLSKMNCNENDQKDLEYIQGELEAGKLLPLQRSKDNSVIPRQVHQTELEMILKNAGNYLPFLNQADSNGITAAQKILSLFQFRIPYYVGPLSDRHKGAGANQWIERKKDGRIYPWNFTEMVDEAKSNEAFITRMTNKCTYIVGEDVLPKNSLLYSRYMVLNELNNLRIRGNKADVATKQSIFNDLFMTKNRVTGKTLLKYLQKNDPDLKLEDISGFNQDFKAQLKSYLDFKKQVLGNRMAEDNVKAMVEEIIRWKTIYGDDSRMVGNAIEKHYPNELSADNLKKISRFMYTGWGNFSRKFLAEIEGVNRETGEVYSSVIDALWETNDNLMQLLGSKYTFSDEINKINSEREKEITEISYDALVKDLYVAPAVKRAIWQTIQITEELRKIQKGTPEKIFVEMARGEEKDKRKKRTTSRKDKLLKLYAGCDKDARNWSKEIEDREEREFNSMKLFLYYSQLGRDMYTGEAIDLDQLMKGNSKWDRDHIYPQSKIKDDSIDNLVLVNKSSNIKKSNELLSSDVQKKMLPFWRELLKMGLISKKKFDRLTRRGEFTEDELSGFIARQLVETRQSTKAVAELLKRIYPDSEVVYVKAGLASNFRKDDLKMLKSRRINDYHHAKDAYLNVVVGNVYNAKFTSDPRKWFVDNKEKNYSINKVFRYDVKNSKGEKVWVGPDRNKDGKLVLNEYHGITGGTIDTVRNRMLQNNILYTEYTYCETGELFNATILKKGSKAATIPLKKGMDIEKYGGYYSPNTSYFAMIEYNNQKKGRIRQILGVPIYVANVMEQDQDAFIHYCENVKGYQDVRIIEKKIKKNSLISVNGFPLRIRGENITNISLKSNMQLVLDFNSEVIIKKIESFLKKNPDYEVEPDKDGFSHEQLNEVYDALLNKLKTVYANRPANQWEKLEKDRSLFINISSLRDKAIVINEILTMLRCDIATSSNLSLLGEGPAVGGIAINKNTISNKCKLVIVNQSVTGVFENRIKL